MLKGYRCDIQECTEFPEELRMDTLYFNRLEHTAAYMCPCGCGEVINILISYEGEPEDRRQSSYDMSVTSDGLVTLKRPVYNPKCGTRFIVRSGLIRSC